MRPLIPTFYALEVFDAWGREQEPMSPRAAWFSPGGFQAFEHHWALPEAFEFHESIGPRRITMRIHELNHQMKEGLAAMPHIKLYTPRDESLSAGMACFDVNGMKSGEVVTRLLSEKIVASTTPYAIPYARTACSIVNTSQEVDKTLAAIHKLG
jgi:selenocysteine lyase/cysteine desulfurase